MLRPFLLAVGIYFCLLGGECLILDRAILAAEDRRPQAAPVGLLSANPMVRKKEFVPPEWAPWSLISGGAVVILYALTINKQ